MNRIQSLDFIDKLTIDEDLHKSFDFEEDTRARSVQAVGEYTDWRRHACFL